jgi:hypothetical protein
VASLVVGHGKLRLDGEDTGCGRVPRVQLTMARLTCVRTVRTDHHFRGDLVVRPVEGDPGDDLAFAFGQASDPRVNGFALNG